MSKLTCLDDKIWFPPPEEAQEDGLLAYGGDLSEERLLLAYRSGIFPWFEDELPWLEESLPLWWHPDPRFVLYPKDLKISKTVRLDADVLLWLQEKADEEGLGYQTFLNSFLKKSMKSENDKLDEIYKRLKKLEDKAK